jgi:heptose-I-phosphate ethanolaminephosphotransferase
VAATAVAMLLIGFLGLAHEGRRVVQLLVLAAPPILWLLWPIRSIRISALRACAVWLWALLFILDSAVRAFLLAAYEAAPESAMVMGAVANTGAAEVAEYMTMYWQDLLIWAAVVLTASLIAGWSVQYGHRPARPRLSTPRGLGFGRRWSAMLLGSLFVLCIGSYASKSWQRLHPIAFWVSWTSSVRSLAAGWQDQERMRRRDLGRAKAASPVVTRDGPRTVMLVISESINRDNMGLYGYQRNTSPQLSAMKGGLSDGLLVLRHAWSVDATTLPALRNLFRFGLPDSDEPPHVLAMARAAGYKVWWIGNHDDIAVEQMHARFAHDVELINRRPGRSGASMDDDLLDDVQEALADSASRKLIVVHLMGAHPHYSLRYPPNANPFATDIDVVERSLIESGRSRWIRGLRNEYDAALLHHDSVVSKLLRMTRDTDPTSARAWMFLSDHGQEVGHSSDRAGHSSRTASGYRIPTLIWRHPDAFDERSAAVTARPFRADWAGWTLMELLGITWRANDSTRNLLHPNYRWSMPEIPAPISSFSE